MEIFDKLCEIIRENAQVEESVNFSEEMTFNELELDSIDVMDIIVTVEDTFGIIIEDEELERIETLGEVVEIIKEKKGI